MKLTAELLNLKVFEGSLTKQVEGIIEGANERAVEAMAEVYHKSQELVPEDTQSLKRSGVIYATSDTDKYTVTVSYGQTGAPHDRPEYKEGTGVRSTKLHVNYHRYVHENPHNKRWRKVFAEDKFLEKPWRSLRSFIIKKVSGK